MCSFLSANEISLFFCASEKFSSRSLCREQEVKDRVDGFGTLSPPCVYTRLRRETQRIQRPTQYLFCPACVAVCETTIHTSLCLSLCSRYMRVCIPSLRRQLSCRQGSPVAARFVPRPRSLAAFLKSSKPFRRYGAHYWLMGTYTDRMYDVGWDRAPSSSLDRKKSFAWEIVSDNVVVTHGRVNRFNPFSKYRTPINTDSK